ncbi:MscS Mechanosensitive ion channel [Paenibacillus vortex V453]|uniref:Mechanosensing system component YbdG n=2 Tax=Paenibacillus TaxID=44249 RepID=A0A163JAU7_9BACL|nr:MULTISPECIES: mechanosensitive ion channel domain-containing protein [Paenibacillus]AWP30061.1 mechanosensitive ion channel protein MscS [Paenibacillus sp. Cedars]EFU43442.1 MscS Mechanosensitive ion channel [Paenibacillus vortex V453]KZS46480.1 mechanosensitive ion channel protein MscS [Paenibacillus glucanolyticus]MDH6671263.1 miniconductance mechanosensitive channel [Paenibacillus sp. LBL]OMF72019.1 mechanosensitive ion channel protein MscS [Paenibacillus glucanolyticus]
MDFIKNQLDGYGMSEQTIVYLSSMIMVLFIALISILANIITKKIVLKTIIHIVNSNRYTWDNIIVEKKVFHKLSHLVPAIIIYFSASIFPSYQVLIEKAAMTYMIIVTIMVFNALLNAFDAIYRSFEISKIRPIKGYIQVANIILFIIGGIVVISNLIGQNPLIILSGLGALSAVLMLVFKDSILGLVAGIQLSSNDMVRVGDWIEMPKYNADGDVIDITLNTVKVMNFDKTITMIPSYALISDSFKNWRGMQVSGGRRIKRSFYIDTSSISFCTQDMIEEFQKIHYLSDYVTTRLNEINAYNMEHQINTDSKVNGRQLTNVGVFREYIHQYLRNHPKIHKDMTLIVRQLAPGDNGLPLEIYTFTNDINWAVYESIQADIFDHIFAVAPTFGLRAFQNPTGHDIVQLKESPEYSRGY